MRHRQTKGAATDMFGLQPLRHTPTLPGRAVPNAKLGDREGWTAAVGERSGERRLLACAVKGRRFPVGAGPTRQPLQPDAGVASRASRSRRGRGSATASRNRTPTHRSSRCCCAGLEVLAVSRRPRQGWRSRAMVLAVITSSKPTNPGTTRSSQAPTASALFTMQATRAPLRTQISSQSLAMSIPATSRHS